MLLLNVFYRFVLNRYPQRFQWNCSKRRANLPHKKLLKMWVGWLFLLYTEWTFHSFLISQRRTVNFRNQCPWRHNCRLYNNHVKVTGNHVKLTRFVLLPVSETESKNMTSIFLVQCINLVFVISRIIKVSVLKCHYDQIFTSWFFWWITKNSIKELKRCLPFASVKYANEMTDDVINATQFYIMYINRVISANLQRRPLKLGRLIAPAGFWPQCPRRFQFIQ